MVRVSRVLDPGRSSAALVLQLKFITEARIISAQLNLNNFSGFLTIISDDMVDGRIYFRSTSLRSSCLFRCGQETLAIDASDNNIIDVLMFWISVDLGASMRSYNNDIIGV